MTTTDQLGRDTRTADAGSQLTAENRSVQIDGDSFVYRRFGIPLPHYTGAQISAGRRVRRRSLRARRPRSFPRHPSLRARRRQSCPRRPSLRARPRPRPGLRSPRPPPYRQSPCRRCPCRYRQCPCRRPPCQRRPPLLRPYRRPPPRRRRNPHSARPSHWSRTTRPASKIRTARRQLEPLRMRPQPSMTGTARIRGTKVTRPAGD